MNTIVIEYDDILWYLIHEEGILTKVHLYHDERDHNILPFLNKETREYFESIVNKG